MAKKNETKTPADPKEDPKQPVDQEPAAKKPKEPKEPVWNQYRRKPIDAEMRPYLPGESLDGVSIGEEDRANGSPREGDMIARDPDNHADQWLVNAEYFHGKFVTDPKVLGRNADDNTRASCAEAKRRVTLHRASIPRAGQDSVIDQEHLRVLVMDEPGPGGAPHDYLLISQIDGDDYEVMIRFQKGPLDQVENNGITNEALLAVVIDRLTEFQGGPFPCVENQQALQHLMRALSLLHTRTAERYGRGVEGRSVE